MRLRRSSLLSCLPILAFGLVSLFLALFANRDCFTLRADGAAWQTYIDYQTRDRAAFSQLGADAHQGNFDAYYPINSDYTIPGAISRLLAGAGPDRIAMYAIYVSALFVCMFLTARFFCGDLYTALLAAFIAGFFFPPSLIGFDAPTFRFNR